MRFSDIKKHLGRFTVGIAGAGGLGSNCAVALARTGIGHLVICDFDVLEEANLNRQYYFRDQLGMVKVDALKENLARINPVTRVTSHNVKLNPSNIIELFDKCDVIVEAFDRADMKEMIAETVQVSMPGIPLVIGSGMAGYGMNDSLRVRKIDDWLYVCGDEEREISETNPPLAPRVSIVAGMQANVVIEILMSREV